VYDLNNNNNNNNYVCTVFLLHTSRPRSRHEKVDRGRPTSWVDPTQLAGPNIPQVKFVHKN